MAVSSSLTSRERDGWLAWSSLGENMQFPNQSTSRIFTDAPYVDTHIGVRYQCKGMITLCQRPIDIATVDNKAEEKGSKR